MLVIQTVNCSNRDGNSLTMVILRARKNPGVSDFSIVQAIRLKWIGILKVHDVNYQRPLNVKYRAREITAKIN